LFLAADGERILFLAVGADKELHMTQIKKTLFKVKFVHFGPPPSFWGQFEEDVFTLSQEAISARAISFDP